MPGKFELYKDKKGAFRFRLKATNGQTILASQGYKRKSNAKTGIESVRKNSAVDARFERKTSRSGMHTFSLRATNGLVIGTSEQYKTESSRDNGIASVRKNAPGAALVDQTI